MKLDLINSRFNAQQRSNLVFDSLEDRSYDLQTKKVSTTHITELPTRGRCYEKRMLTSSLPQIFHTVKVDRKGQVVEVGDRHNPKNEMQPPLSNVTNQCCQDITDLSSALPLRRRHSCQSFLSNGSENSNVNTLENCDDVCDGEPGAQKYFFSPTLDRIRDCSHDDDSYTIRARVHSKHIRGGSWSNGKPLKPNFSTSVDIGPGSYEVYGTTSSATNVILSTRKNYFDKLIDPVIPLKERIRADRQNKAIRKHWGPIVDAVKKRDELLSTRLLDCPLITQRLHIPDVSFAKGTQPRLSGGPYKQEGYIKTTGLLLGPNYDQQFDKRIAFAFGQSSSSDDSVQAIDNSGDIDVDIGLNYSILEAVRKSPIKYSASFRSKASVGMEIPKTVSAAHIGPGSFPNAYKPAVIVNRPGHPSLAFLSGRTVSVRDAVPDSLDIPQPFAMVNRKGPTIGNEKAPGVGGRNEHLAKIVKDKMTKIYPRLANVKFRSTAKVDTQRDKLKRK
jgi:hypothetical protein